jgi:hypothetical protein
MNKIVLAIISTCFLTSCYYDNKEELYQNYPQDCITTGLTYSMDIKPIMDRACVDCHSPGGNASFWPLTTYTEVLAQESSILDRISRPNGSSGAMPPSGQLEKCEIDRINMWFADGAPQ